MQDESKEPVQPANTIYIPPSPKRSLVMPILLTFIITSALYILGFFGFRYIEQLFRTPPLLMPEPSPTISPSPIIASDWKTFSQHNISFQYPSHYFIKTSEQITGSVPFTIFIYSDSMNQKLIASISLDKAASINSAVSELPQISSPEELPSISSNGGTFPITKYTSKESVPSNYSDCSDTQNESLYRAQINKTTAITIHQTEINTCQENGQVTSEKTTATEFDTAKQILSTFNFTGIQEGPTEYSCPINGWVNCMPMLNEPGQRACSDQAIAWYQTNCPDYQGIAR